MLKNNQLLYILPEMAFTAGVGETPKQDYYFVQTFHQINGEFMRDENFIHESLKKLFERVEEGTYTLVLPDFLFTDTIVNVPETQDVKIAEYLRDQLLPRIEVSTFSHETRTSVLLQRKTTSKVQLSAFEKELAAALKLAIGSRAVVIDEIVPLSWVLKAAVSLEPSLTIAQLGERLYLAEHYIGINQTVNAPLDDLDIIAETVKTLKGSDPNLQTTYLFTSVLVEDRLKKFLLKTLPVQQLTEPTDEESKIPSYVKQIIEVTARTLSLTDFAVPRFSLQVNDLVGQLPTAPAAPALQARTESLEEATPAVAPTQSQPITTSASPAPAVSEPAPTPAQPEPVATPVVTAAASVASLASEPETPTEAAAETTSETTAAPATSAPAPAVDQSTSTTPAATDQSAAPAVAAAALDPQPEPTPVSTLTPAPAGQAPVGESPTNEPAPAPSEQAPTSVSSEPASASAATTPAPTVAPVSEPVTPQPVAKVDQLPEAAPPASLPEAAAMPKLSFMAVKQLPVTPAAQAATSEATAKPETVAKTTTKSTEKGGKISTKDKGNQKKVVGKKKGNMQSFFKKLLLFILIFVIVIALGIGVGVAILYMTGKDIFQPSEVVPTEMSPLPTPEPEPVVESTSSAEASASATAEVEPEPEEELDPSEYDLLVVNATGIAGLAGQMKTTLEKEGFSNVQTGNAAGTYDVDGTFVLMKDRDSALIKYLEDATGKTITYDEDYQDEDAAGKYDAVIVLNEQ